MIDLFGQRDEEELALIDSGITIELSSLGGVYDLCEDCGHMRHLFRCTNLMSHYFPS